MLLYFLSFRRDCPGVGDQIVVAFNDNVALAGIPYLDEFIQYLEDEGYTVVFRPDANGLHAEIRLYAYISDLAGKLGIDVNQLIYSIGINNSGGPCYEAGSNFCGQFFQMIQGTPAGIPIYYLGRILRFF
jgi:hypothetical protein